METPERPRLPRPRASVAGLRSPRFRSAAGGRSRGRPVARFHSLELVQEARREVFELAQLFPVPLRFGSADFDPEIRPFLFEQISQKAELVVRYIDVHGALRL